MDFIILGALVGLALGLRELAEAIERIEQAVGSRPREKGGSGA